MKNNIEEFVDVRNSESLRFCDIWRIYDHQFSVLRNFINTMGDKYEVEEFTNSTSKVLELSHRYSSKQVFVYINEVIQWKDRDYEETSPNKITLLHERTTSDIIRVVIVKSNILQADITECEETLKNMLDGYSRKMEEMYQSYLEKFQKLEEEYPKIVELVEILKNNGNITI